MVAKLFLRSFFFLSTFATYITAQTDFQCDISKDTVVNLNDTTFDTIDARYKVSWNDDYLMPDKIHWHIYIVNDDLPASFATYPANLLEAKINGRKLQFEGRNTLKEMGYSKGDSIQASVTVYVPHSQLLSVNVDGIDYLVEIVSIADEMQNTSSSTTLNIEMSGIDSSLYVNTPSHRVFYEGSGVDNTAKMIIGENSKIKLSGIDQRAEVKADVLDSLELSGVDQNILLEGDCSDMEISGIDSTLRINSLTSSCNDVDIAGNVGSKCRTTTDPVSVPVLDCLAETKVVKACDSNVCWDISTGAVVAITLGALCLCVAGVVGCCCCLGCLCCGSRQRETQKVVVPPQYHQPAVIDASVIEVKPMENATSSAAGVYSQDPEQPHATQNSVYDRDPVVVDAKVY